MHPLIGNLASSGQFSESINSTILLSIWTILYLSLSVCMSNERTYFDWVAVLMGAPLVGGLMPLESAKN